MNAASTNLMKDYSESIDLNRFQTIFFSKDQMTIIDFFRLACHSKRSVDILRLLYIVHKYTAPLEVIFQTKDFDTGSRLTNPSSNK